jgi:RraA family protein
MTSKVTAAGPALLALFHDVQTAVISDNLARLQGAVGLRPFHGGGIMAGRALTIRTACGDNQAIHKALDLVQPGDVVVADGGGDVSRALMGEIMLTIAKSRGAVGLVVDGAIRDAAAIARLGFPVFARAAIHRGPFKNGPGEINVPVSIGGMVVNPGDIVVGDEDGVVAFPPGIALELAEKVRAQEQKEADILTSIANGTYTGAYTRP